MASLLRYAVLPGVMSRTPPNKYSEMPCLERPTGSPMKLAFGTITKIAQGRFPAGIDTYPGTSGSPVFDAKSHPLIGIHSRGQQDYGDRFVMEYGGTGGKTIVDAPDVAGGDSTPIGQ